VELLIKQIALPLSLDRQFSFGNFFSDKSDLIVDNLKSLIRGKGEVQIGLWGQACSGKTHLLNACAHYARKEQIAMQIYDGLQLANSDASEFEGFSHCEVLAIDNLDAIAGIGAWEERFYQAINQCRQGDFRFIYSLSQSPQYLKCQLHDFQSRLLWGLLLQLPESNENDISIIINKRARLLGLELPAEVISYLLTHHSRNLAAQMEILRTLDDASLIEQRKVTIPLVKQALQELASG
jgi:DnaA family protein